MLKVIKYKNHGICMRGGDIKEHHQKFLFSFFELNNNKIISLMIVENWHKDKLISDEYNCFYTKYKFDQTWEIFWKNTFKNDERLTDENTYKYIKSFFKNNFYSRRYKIENISFNFK